MLYLNLSGHDIFKKRFGTSPEKKLPNSNALPPFFKETHEIDIKSGHNHIFIFILNFFDTN